MKKMILGLLLFTNLMGVNAQWQPASPRMMTSWGEKVNPQEVLPEYPRPTLVRERWVNLNGLWNYAIMPKGAAEPRAFQGEILVPFGVESALSGVGKEVGEKNELWYHRTFTVPNAWKGADVLLQFGAVDWQADVFVNDVAVGSHRGGYTPFTLNITSYLKNSAEQKLVVRVWDPTDAGYQPIGKQLRKPNGIWYTAVTGIWQTVWMEPVPKTHVSHIAAVADIDNQVLGVTVAAEGASENTLAHVELRSQGKLVATAKGRPGITMRMEVKNPRLWSPEDPFLYEMTVALTQGGRALDQVDSYTAMRKTSVARDANGFMRLQLNNKDIYQHGPLDQGWWPDGLYTAPSDEALLFDILKTKEWGFNMIRKHVKVEPARWYYHCDREGVLVWQDMPNGDRGNKWEPRRFGGGTDCARTPASVKNYYQEWREIIDLLISNPSVVMWVPFNEAWGQFDTEKVTEWTRNYDPSRPINSASGGNHRNCGEVLDIHHYPDPRLSLMDETRVNVVGEYGGIGLPLEGHLWLSDRNWGYIQFKNSDEVTREYVKYTDQLMKLAERGCAASVYTQTTDVEGEVNGLMTYDRKVMKVNESRVREANRKIIESNSKK